MIRLPSDFRARSVSDKAGATAIRSSDQESGHGIDAVVEALSPFDNPIERQRDIVRGKCFYVRMNINEVDRSWTCCRQDAEVVALRVKRIEGAQRVRRWMISARNVRLCAESRFQRNRGNPIARFRCNGPGTDVCSSEAAKLPKRFIIEIPAGVFAGDGSRYSRAQ